MFVVIININGCITINIIKDIISVDSYNDKFVKS